jgi:hypothetical protein
VCPELDSLRALYLSLPSALSEAVEEELSRLPRALLPRTRGQVWSAVYMPQLGYAILVEGGRPPPEVLDCLPDWELMLEGEDENFIGEWRYHFPVF